MQKKTINFLLYFLLSLLFSFVLGCNEDELNLIENANRKIQADLIWSMVNVNTSSQGDAHVIQVYTGKTILIDAGYCDIAEKELIPFLEKNNIIYFDIVFISHPHKDHYCGLKPLLDSGIKIKTIYFNIPDKEICDSEIPWGCDYEHILDYHQLLKNYNIEIKVAEAGQYFDLGAGAAIEILYAFDGINTPVGQTDINDMSLIMMLEYAGYKMLFTGDLNRTIGEYLAKNANDIKADILKVPHHGTDGLTPNSFFDTVNPKYALIPSPPSLWCSDRSSRARNYFLDNNIPAYVNGFSGNVQVVILDGELNIVPDEDVLITCE